LALKKKLRKKVTFRDKVIKGS